MRQMKYTRAEKLKIAKEHVIDSVSLNELKKDYQLHRILQQQKNSL